MVVAANNNFVVTSVMSVIALYLTSITCQPTNLVVNKKTHVIKRKRQTMKSLWYLYGSSFKKAYRMPWKSFKKLHRLLKARLDTEPKESVPNGSIA
jgi:hypothetical protein